MNIEEIKKACDENLTVINSDGNEILVLFASNKTLVAKYIKSNEEYAIDFDHNIDWLIEWRLKPVTKKYYLWKLKQDACSELEASSTFYDDEFKDTNNYVCNILKTAHYKEKIESTMHEE